jgi:L-aminopeptidase/D-esterase-like protein
MSNFIISRRQVLMSSLAFWLKSTPIHQTFAQSNSNSSITDVSGIKVGHFIDSRRPTGCTVILTESGAVAGVDVRGAASGTRETGLLDPKNLVQQVHAILLAGGNAFGKSVANGNVTLLGAASAEAMAQAVIRAVRNAKSIAGLPSSKDLISAEIK